MVRAFRRTSSIAAPSSSSSSSSSSMLRTAAAVAIVALGSSSLLVSAQSSGFTQPGGPNAPLTTNNAQTGDCVQFGSCTNGGGSVTISQATPVVSPASSLQSVPVPENTAQLPAFISSLAAAGAESAFSSRGGQTLSLGSPNAGATSLPGSSPSAGQAPTSVASANGNASGGSRNAASGRVAGEPRMVGAAAVGVIFAGALAGAVYLV